MASQVQWNSDRVTSVFTLGMAVADFVFYMDRLPSEAQKYKAGQAAIIGGGCAANAAVAVARLGGKARLAARLGRDHIGDLITRDLEAEGVDISRVDRSTGARSSYSAILVDQAGERQIINFRGDGLREDTSWLSEFQPSDAVLVDPRWSAGAAFALKKAREWGVPGVLDGEAPVDPALLSLASHIVFSRQGLEAVSGCTKITEGLQALRNMSDAFLCATDGANGTYWLEGNKIHHFPAFKVKTVDTLAAGDVWHGAFALALANRQSEAEAICFASAAAALKCTKQGGRDGAPDLATTLLFLKHFGLKPALLTPD